MVACDLVALAWERRPPVVDVRVDGQAARGPAAALVGAQGADQGGGRVAAQVVDRAVDLVGGRAVDLAGGPQGGRVAVLVGAPVDGRAGGPAGAGMAVARRALWRTVVRGLAPARRSCRRGPSRFRRRLS